MDHTEKGQAVSLFEEQSCCGGGRAAAAAAPEPTPPPVDMRTHTGVVDYGPLTEQALLISDEQYNYTEPDGTFHLLNFVRCGHGQERIGCRLVCMRGGRKQERHLPPVEVRWVWTQAAATGCKCACVGGNRGMFPSDSGVTLDACMVGWMHA
eukprot:183158-Chlamydomonas_euryale.AAC.2